MTFREFLDDFGANPSRHLLTSQMLIFDALCHFGYEIVVRSGEPVFSFRIFQDLFGDGTTGVFGQEFSIKTISDVLEAVGKEAGPPRGLVLVGPPASGKTNIVDLIAQAVEEFTKQETITLYTFAFRFGDGDETIELRSSFNHNPLLLVPVTLRHGSHVVEARRELFRHVQERHGFRVAIPGFFLTATLDKWTMEIVQLLRQNPRNASRSLYELYDEHIVIEEFTFSAALGRGVSNINDISLLSTETIRTRHSDLDPSKLELLRHHLPGFRTKTYEGAIVGSNRGLLHIHDAFVSRQGHDGPSEDDYKPLLMLLGSGKAAIETTQVSIDTSVMVTTNVEEMQLLEKQFLSSKFIDRIEQVPVNYLLDYTSEQKILERDLGSLRRRYDIDPNMLRVASWFSVMSRLLPPNDVDSDNHYWNDARRNLYYRITPEQKLLIYACRGDDPIGTIHNLPAQHPFRGQATRLGVDLDNHEVLQRYIAYDPHVSARLDSLNVFTAEEISLIDDHFMRTLLREHWLSEGQNGISVRQLQNIVRRTITRSDGSRILTTSFLSELELAIANGQDQKWGKIAVPPSGETRCPARKIGGLNFLEDEGNYGNYQGLALVAKALYHDLIHLHITVSVVDRNPREIEHDVRRYLQYCCLRKAQNNRAFAHIMVPRFSFLDPKTGHKVEDPDLDFMESIEHILRPEDMDPSRYREIVADKAISLMQDDFPKAGIINGHDDGILESFSTEYSRLLSNRRVDGAMSPELLTECFFQMAGEGEGATPPHEDSEADKFAKHVLERMHDLFSYSPAIALETIVYSIREKVVDLSQILTRSG